MLALGVGDFGPGARSQAATPSCLSSRVGAALMETPTGPRLILARTAETIITIRAITIRPTLPQEIRVMDLPVAIAHQEVRSATEVPVPAAVDPPTAARP